MSGCNCSGSSAAKSCTVGYFANNPGVTMFTRTSVDWAERIVATSNSHALRCVRAQVTWGYIWSRPAIIWRTRSGFTGSYLAAALFFGMGGLGVLAGGWEARRAGELFEGTPLLGRTPSWRPLR